MKAVILAGGFGTRLSEETHAIPKPMIHIGGRPILWHIMKIYSHYGINEFIICLGYKGHVIKDYFANYYRYNSDITFDLGNNTEHIHSSGAEPWRVTLVDTGLTTMTGGRLKRIREYVANEDDFCLTYGDGLANIDIGDLLRFHRNHGKLATVTAVQPLGRFGVLQLEKDGQVHRFTEKLRGDGDYINGGFFVLSPRVLSAIKDDQTLWEKEPISELVRNRQLMSFIHTGFWHPMDTLRDKTHLENQWSSGKALWKCWHD